VPTTVDALRKVSPSAQPHSTISQPSATTARAKLATLVDSPSKTAQEDLELLAALMFSFSVIIAPESASANIGTPAGTRIVAYTYNRPQIQQCIQQKSG
jgi:hypothetical protein